MATTTKPKLIRKQTEFRFRPGFRPGGVKPADAAAELKRLHESNGSLTPELVIDAASDEDNPLHAIFDWNNESAAASYRLMQARNLIRSVQIVTVENDRSPVYVRVKVEDQSQYQPVSTVVRSRTMYESALELLMSKLGEAQESVRQLRSAAPNAAWVGQVEKLLNEARQAAGERAA